MIRLKQLIFERMTPQEADRVFSKFGVSSAISLPKDELKKEFRKLSLKNHPDVGGNHSDMRDINSAYDVLKNSTERIFNNNSTNYRGRSNHADDVWAQAGWSGGMPNSTDIRSNLDVNFFKKKAWEVSGKPKGTSENEYTFWNWDGRYFRGVFSVFCVPSKFFEVSKMLIEWDNWNKSQAVFVSKKNVKNKVFLVNLRGKNVEPALEYEHESFNSNPGNDSSFVNQLRNNL